MVAKLKTSFLKSGFQLFCHKAPSYNNTDQPNNPAVVNTSSRLVENDLSMKSSVQFSSSPNLTLPDTHLSLNNKNTDSQIKDVSLRTNDISNDRSLSASGRVIEGDNNAESPDNNRRSENGTETNQSINNKDNANENHSKPAKKIPKYLAKSKEIQRNNNTAIVQNFYSVNEPKKQRSKSSNCLMRNSFYENHNNIHNGEIILEPEINNNSHNTPNKINQNNNRHSYPNNSGVQNTDEIQVVSNDNDINGNVNYNRQSHCNLHQFQHNNSTELVLKAKSSDNNNNNSIQQTLHVPQNAEFIIEEDQEPFQHDQNKPNPFSNHLIYNNTINNNNSNVNSTTTSSNASSGGSLYKNNQTIANLKLAKQLQLQNRNTTTMQEFANSLQNKHSNTNKSIIFNYKNTLTNGNSVESAPSSILCKKQKFSKGNNLLKNKKNQTEHEKKTVRFADSLGLELASIITLNQNDPICATRRRALTKYNPSPPNNKNHIHYFNQNNIFHNSNKNLAYPKNGSAIRNNSIEKLNFAKVNNRNNHKANFERNNLNHKDNGHDSRKYIENTNHSKNQFEDNGNNSTLYDDIINKIAFASSNDSNINTTINKAPQQCRYGGNSKGFHPNILPYHLLNNYSHDGLENSLGLESLGRNSNNVNNNHNFRGYLNGNGFLHNQASNQAGINNQTQPQNITITTRINNGKLESEV